MEELRIVHKARYNEQIFLTVPALSTPLLPSTIRVRTKIIGLSSNNLSYCAAGELLHWWEAFPLPTQLPEPYENAAEYGIAPGWGYAVVLDSMIAQIKPGAVVFGFLPISSHAFDLKLQSAETPNHWLEVSPHRSKVMSMYQRYNASPDDFDTNTSLALWTAALIKGEAGYVLARYVFPQDNTIPIHPMGQFVSRWTDGEAGLQDACFVAIASGTKTAKSFIHELVTISATKQPEYSCVVEVTSGAGCSAYCRTIPFRHKVISYDAVSSADAFPQCKKYILLNFGGRDNAIEKVFNSIRQAHAGAQVVVVQIGGEPQVVTKEISSQKREILAKLEAFQMNTTGIRDAAIERLWERVYFEAIDNRFQELVHEQTTSFDGRVLGMNLEISEGLQSDQGVKGVWTRISNGQLSGTEAFVVRL